MTASEIAETPDLATVRFPWCATCNERLVMDVDGWFVHVWQANGGEFTDEQYPIVWRDHP